MTIPIDYPTEADQASAMTARLVKVGHIEIVEGLVEAVDGGHWVTLRDGRHVFIRDKGDPEIAPFSIQSRLDTDSPPVKPAPPVVPATPIDELGPFDIDKIPVPPGLAAAKTIPEIHAWFGKHYPDVEIDLTGMDPELAHELAVTYNGLATLYEPLEDGYVWKIWAREGGSYAGVSSAAGHFIGMNNKYFQSRETANAMNAHAREVGYQDEGVTNPIATFAHEYSHHLFYSLSRKTGGSTKIPEKTSDLAKITRMKNRGGINIYAKTNGREAWAEAFEVNLYKGKAYDHKIVVAQRDYLAKELKAAWAKRRAREAGSA